MPSMLLAELLHAISCCQQDFGNEHSTRVFAQVCLHLWACLQLQYRNTAGLTHIWMQGCGYVACGTCGGKGAAREAAVEATSSSAPEPQQAKGQLICMFQISLRTVMRVVHGLGHCSAGAACAPSKELAPCKASQGCCCSSSGIASLPCKAGQRCCCSPFSLARPHCRGPSSVKHTLRGC